MKTSINYMENYKFDDDADEMQLVWKDQARMMSAIMRLDALHGEAHADPEVPDCVVENYHKQLRILHKGYAQAEKQYKYWLYINAKKSA